ncbi:MAG: tetratricopeptide repeat protein [Candidatus Binatia bacterium]
MAWQLARVARARKVQTLLLALLAAGAFANAIPNGFVWLDHWQVEHGGLIVRSWSEFWTSLRQPLGSMPAWHGAAPYARPLVILLLSVDHWLAGLHASAYHLTVVFVHLANVLLVFDLLRALGMEQRASFFAAALFAVHPLQTAAVAWISGIADPLCTLFLLLAFRCHLVALRRERLCWLARLGALLSFLCALASKETALIFPFLLTAAHFFFPDMLAQASASPRGRRRLLARTLAPFFVLLVVDLLYRALVLHGAALGTGFASIPLAVRLRTVPRLVVSYLALPFRFDALTVCDDWRLSASWDAATVAATVALGCLLAALAWGWRRWPFVAFGVTWMLLALIPVLNIVPILHYRADRFFYLPFIGWSLACVRLAQASGAMLVQRGIVSAQRLRHGAALLGVLTLVALTSLTARRNALFADDVTLFESTLRVSPWCREAHTALGDAFLRAGRAADAARQYERALRARPHRASYVVLPKVLINLGMAKLAVHNYAAAEAAFTRAHHLQPQLLHPLFGLGVANLGLGRASTAATWLEAAYAHAPNNPDVVVNLGLSYDRLGRAAQAAALYRRYLRIAPSGDARELAEARLHALHGVAR